MVPSIRYRFDYYPFGSIMVGRNWSIESTDGYRFGFNGKENDNETYGDGNEIAFEARIYDSRLGRFLSNDPKQREYPWQSTYAYYKNSPITIIDIKGRGGPFEEDALPPSTSSDSNQKGSEAKDDKVPDKKRYQIK